MANICFCHVCYSRTTNTVFCLQCNRLSQTKRNNGISHLFQLPKRILSTFAIKSIFCQFKRFREIISSAFELEKWPLGLSSFTFKLFDVSFIIVYLFKMKRLQCHRKWIKLLIPITFKRCQLFSIWISIHFVKEIQIPAHIKCQRVDSHRDSLEKKRFKCMS